MGCDELIDAVVAEDQCPDRNRAGGGGVSGLLWSPRWAASAPPLGRPLSSERIELVRYSVLVCVGPVWQASDEELQP